MLVSWRSRLYRLVSFPISVGIVPVARFAGKKDGRCERTVSQPFETEIRQREAITDHAPGHVMTITRILVAPSSFVKLISKDVSFTRLPMSGGMAPWEQEEARRSL